MSVLFFSCTSDSNKVLCFENKIGKLELYQNGTFVETIYRQYDLGGIDDTIALKGLWHQNDTIIELSAESPYEDINDISFVEREKNIEGVQVRIVSKDDLPLFFIAPRLVKINDTILFIKQPNVTDTIRIDLNDMHTIHSIELPGYKKLNLDGLTSNSCTIKIGDLDDQFKTIEYFFSKRYLYKDDKIELISKNNFEVSYNNTLTSCEKVKDADTTVLEPK